MLSLFRRSAEPEVATRTFDVGDRRRVYAIGDIHGRYDLLNKMIDKILEEQEYRGSVDDFRLILLGDLIDRGPNSASVVDLALTLTGLWPGFACIKGNHEEVFAQAFLGNPHAIKFFCGIGRETLLSYDIEPDLIDREDVEALHAAMLTQVPEAHRDFITGLPSYIELGEYLFVHAGIRPGIAMEYQSEQDMHWIRGEFLKSKVEHPFMVIHGHSITETVDERPNRIGIDTGAYMSHKLTAIGLEGTQRWFLST